MPCPHEAALAHVTAQLAATREALAATQRRERTWRRVAEIIHAASQPQEE